MLAVSLGGGVAVPAGCGEETELGDREVCEECSSGDSGVAERRCAMGGGADLGAAVACAYEMPVFSFGGVDMPRVMCGIWNGSRMISRCDSWGLGLRALYSAR